MTYENVVSWCEKNKPQEEYDTFAEWYSACEDAVNTPNLFESADFNKLMEDSWLNSFGTFDRGTKPIQVPTQTTLPLPKEQPKPEAVVILPKTGSAPIISKPVLVVPANIPEKQKQSLFTRFKNFVLRKKPIYTETKIQQPIPSRPKVIPRPIPIDEQVSEYRQAIDAFASGRLKKGEFNKIMRRLKEKYDKPL